VLAPASNTSRAATGGDSDAAEATSFAPGDADRDAGQGRGDARRKERGGAITRDGGFSSTMSPSLPSAADDLGTAPRTAQEVPADALEPRWRTAFGGDGDPGSGGRGCHAALRCLSVGGRSQLHEFFSPSGDVTSQREYASAHSHHEAAIGSGTALQAGRTDRLEGRLC
jgi:hypothetical protein